jgi:hypothetical protein
VTTLAEYEFAITKVLTEENMSTKRMLDYPLIRLYAQAYLEHGLPVETAAKYMNSLSGNDAYE